MKPYGQVKGTTRGAETPAKEQQWEGLTTLGLRKLEAEWPYPSPWGAGAVGKGAPWQEQPWRRVEPLPKPSAEVGKSREQTP